MATCRSESHFLLTFDTCTLLITRFATSSGISTFAVAAMVSWAEGQNGPRKPLVRASAETRAI